MLLFARFFVHKWNNNRIFHIMHSFYPCHCMEWYRLYVMISIALPIFKIHSTMNIWLLQNFAFTKMLLWIFYMYPGAPVKIHQAYVQRRGISESTVHFTKDGYDKVLNIFTLISNELEFSLIHIFSSTWYWWMFLIFIILFPICISQVANCMIFI